MNVCISVYAHLDNAQDSRVTETSQKQQGLCVLPPYPANGAYSVVNKADAKPGDGLQAVYVVYSCRHGHALVGSKDVHCVNNVWTAEAPRCEASTSMTNKDTAASTVSANTNSAWSYSGTEVTGFVFLFGYDILYLSNQPNMSLFLEFDVGTGSATTLWYDALSTTKTD
ncbi:hypothetical protein EVAR_97811_1 [Eumeta japonica]|uniref:Sushi domain-containing protein n=1 Tax=Eumeta variegata TaxID=151549 RepID=A0A4C1X9W0_EUMVA|nr:hypothetical protein EVAR_97811_1 [Eumeta japonica]